MRAIVLLDTSVYLNILDVPGYNQDRNSILDEFQHKIEDEDLFFLPMATMWETGNHISGLPDGRQRFRFGTKLVEDVSKAIEGVAPYRPTYLPSREEFFTWLREFPEFVKLSKSERKTDGGVSLSDLSIIKEWEVTRKRSNMSKVLIWSLDSDLAGYDSSIK